MSSSNGQESKDQKPKKRSTLNFLFNPRIDREIEPIKESAGMFVRMLALIFASYRLFPQNHPAFGDPRIRLTMADVIGTAFRGLSFTKKGIPQIAVFAAVTGCLAFTILAIITILLSMFVGSANAQVFQYTQTDWGVQWIDWIFMGERIENTGSIIPTPNDGGAMQRALGTALSFYSTAILALAGFLLMYHLAFMIAEQAHSGKIMGRANQIWAPIRLVFAIGMLVPIGTGGGGATVVGYNTGQYLAMQTARWGSGLASNVWSNFALGTGVTSNLGVCESTTPAGDRTTTGDTPPSPSCINIDGPVVGVVRGLVAMEACSFIMNFYIDQAQTNDAANWDPDINEFSAGGALWSPAGALGSYGSVISLRRLEITPGRHYLGLQTSTVNNFNGVNVGALCGGYEILPPPTTNAFSSVYQAQLDQFETVKNAVAGFVSTYGRDMIQSSGVYSQRTLAARRDAIARIVDTYQSSLRTAVRSSLQTAQGTIQANARAELQGPRYTTTGWLMASSWFNQISRIMGDRSTVVRNGTPILLKPTLSDQVAQAPTGTLSGAMDQARTNYTSFMNSFDTEIKLVSIGTPRAYDAAGGGLDDVSFMDFVTAKTVTHNLLALIDKAGIYFGIWREGGLALQFGAEANPLVEISAMGHNFIDTGMRVLGFAGMFYTGALVAAAGLLNFLGGLCATIAGLLFLAGFTFAFLIPLYPFYRFFFGAIKWIMTVFEAVVLAPLFALAHVSPYGEGLAGQYAKYGYAVFMQILLRPVMMVFGLIAGYLLFGATLHFLNDAFVVVTQGSGAYAGGATGGNAVIAKIVYSLIYCALVLLLANQCFSTIGLFPQVITSYLGMSSVREEQVGDTHLMAAAAGYVAKDVMMSKLPAATKAIPGAIQGSRDKAASTLGAETQQATLDSIERNTR